MKGSGSENDRKLNGDSSAESGIVFTLRAQIYLNLIISTDKHDHVKAKAMAESENSTFS